MRSNEACCDLNDPNEITESHFRSHSLVLRRVESNFALGLLLYSMFGQKGQMKKVWTYLGKRGNNCLKHMPWIKTIQVK